MTEGTTTAPASISRAQRWEDRTAWPAFLLSIVFFVASVWLLGDDEERAWVVLLLSLTIVVCWLAFIADFVVRLAVSGDRRTFLRRRWFELVSLVIPYLRPFVILAYVWRLPVFQRSSAALRTRFVVSVVLFALLFVYTGSTMVWLVERHHEGATIVSLGDAIWWGFTTITTVGYGDFVPVTVPGRAIAVGMMVGGVVVLGVTSATIISVLTDQVHRLGLVAEQQRSARAAALAAAPAEQGRRHHGRSGPDEPPTPPQTPDPPTEAPR